MPAPGFIQKDLDKIVRANLSGVEAEKITKRDGLRTVPFWTGCIQVQPAQQALGSSGHEEKTRAREGPRVSPCRAPVPSFAHYFQAPATQANSGY